MTHDRKFQAKIRISSLSWTNKTYIISKIVQKMSLIFSKISEKVSKSRIFRVMGRRIFTIGCFWALILFNFSEIYFSKKMCLSFVDCPELKFFLKKTLKNDCRYLVTSPWAPCALNFCRKIYFMQKDLSNQKIKKTLVSEGDLCKSQTLRVCALPSSGSNQLQTYIYQ